VRIGALSVAGQRVGDKQFRALFDNRPLNTVVVKRQRAIALLGVFICLRQA
jgi:hypothetical protein